MGYVSLAALDVDPKTLRMVLAVDRELWCNPDGVRVLGVKSSCKCFGKFFRKHDMCFHNVLRKHDQSFHTCFRKFSRKHDQNCTSVSTSFSANTTEFPQTFPQFLPQTRQSFHSCFRSRVLLLAKPQRCGKALLRGSLSHPKDVEKPSCELLLSQDDSCKWL